MAHFVCAMADLTLIIGCPTSSQLIYPLIR